MCSYAAPSPARALLWIFERNEIQTPALAGFTAPELLGSALLRR
jgi:hypothetical protein